MKLTSFRLCNFRQFYGSTPEIVLATEDKRQITVIHGNNGAGKTTLLNAFTWVLYERFTAAFESPEQLVNKRAIAEAQIGNLIECWVEVAFEHGDTRYRMRRDCRTVKTESGISEGKTELRLRVAGDDGRWKIADQHPEDVIGKIQPASLHQYFFFDGERIEQIVRSNKKAEIAEATKTLLGLEIPSRSIAHLSTVRKLLEKELEAIGNPETQQLLRQKEKLEQAIDQTVAEQEEIEQELENYQSIKQEVSQRLRQLDAVKEIQKRRDDLEAQEKVEREKLRQSKVNLKLAVSTRGYTVLLADTTAKFRALVDGLRQRGELPADMKQQFVQDLLSRQRCICGTELVEGTSPHEHVRAYLDKAGLADVEETVIRMSAQVEAIDQQIPKFWEDVDQEQAHINQLKGSLSRIETALDDIRGQLKNSPSEDIRKLESRLEEVEAKIQQLTLQQGENQQKIIDREAEIEKLSRQIEKLQMNEERQALAQRRIAATEDAIARLKQVLNNMDTVFRIELEKRVQEIFSQIVVVPYLPKLTEKYELTLVEATTGQESPVAASTGENQVLSLSFIGAIIDRVRQWSKDKSRMLMGPDSGTFPIVMDSPFGSLDELYRREVGRSLPLLANQLVVLVSKTQWRGEVAEEMATYIGKEYVLAYNSSKPNVQPDQIELGGVSYPLVRQSPNEFDYTEILEVTHL